MPQSMVRSMSRVKLKHNSHRSMATVACLHRLQEVDSRVVFNWIKINKWTLADFDLWLEAKKKQIQSNQLEEISQSLESKYGHANYSLYYHD